MTCQDFVLGAPRVSTDFASCDGRSGLPSSKFVKQVSESDASFLKWACRAVLEWVGGADIGDTPIFQIHGDNDPVLLIKNTSPDQVLQGGGHAISVMHPEEVTRFLKAVHAEMTHEQSIEKRNSIGE